MSNQVNDENDEKKDAPNFVHDIAEFHEKFELEYTGKPTLLGNELAHFREMFMREELEEYIAATAQQGLTYDDQTKQLENALDALVDLVYVAIGTAYLHGFDFNEAWRRVHAANMSKIRAERPEDSKRNTSFDVVKPAGWVAPCHHDLVKDHE